MTKQLHDASGAGDMSAIHALLAAGVNPNSRSGSKGLTAMHRAAFMGCEEAIQALVGAGALPDSADW